MGAGTAHVKPSTRVTARIPLMVNLRLTVDLRRTPHRRRPAAAVPPQQLEGGEASVLGSLMASDRTRSCGSPTSCDPMTSYLDHTLQVFRRR